MTKRKSVKQTMLILMAALLFVCLVPLSSAANDDDADIDCRDVSANQSVTANLDGTTDGRITQGGMLNGRTHFVPSGFFPTAVPDVFLLTGNLTITTKKGTLTTSDTAIFNPGKGLFTDIAQITGGTGDFAGATGVLFISGITTDGGATFDDKIVGNICLAD